MKRRSNKIQFSKLHVVFADFIVLFVYTTSAALSFLDKQPISDVAIAVITVYGAFATGGYFAQNCIRDCSWNKTFVDNTEQGNSERSEEANIY